MRTPVRNGLIALLLLLVAQAASAFSFVPTPSEFRSWPEYCQAKYVITNIGLSSNFVLQVPKSVVEKWMTAEPPWWSNIHHGCAGMLWIRRAERLAGRDKQQFDFALGQAHGEAHYSVIRTPTSEPMHWLLQSVLAREAYLRGQRDHAIHVLQIAAQKAPEVEEVHATLGLLLYKQKRLPEALKALQFGMEHVKEPGAEINYLTGFVLARLERYAEAEPYAAAAYRLGYPAPWLRNRLRAQGLLKSAR